MKRFIYYILIIFISCLALTPRVYALPPAPDAPNETIKRNNSTEDMYIPTTDYDRDDDFAGNCADFAPTIRIGGYLVMLVKILVPLIIIIKASMSFISVVTNGRPDELKKKASKLVNSLIAGIIIFFIPSLIYIVFGFISNFNTDMTEDSKICTYCIFKPFSDECSNYADKR